MSDKNILKIFEYLELGGDKIAFKNIYTVSIELYDKEHIQYRLGLRDRVGNYLGNEFGRLEDLEENKKKILFFLNMYKERETNKTLTFPLINKFYSESKKYLEG